MQVIKKHGMDDTVQKWSGTGLLKGLDEYKALHMAIILENQRITNEVVNNYMQQDDTRRTFFNKVSIPLVRRVFGLTPLWDLISIQSMLGPAGVIYNRDKYGNIKEFEIAGKSRVLSNYIPLIQLREGQEATGVPLDSDTGTPLLMDWGVTTGDRKWYVEGDYAAKNKDFQSENKLDQEADLCLHLATEISNEITREVFTDLSKNCPTFEKPWKTPIHLVDTIFYAAENTTRNVGRPANWLVTSPHLVLEMVRSGELAAREGYEPDVRKIQHVGKLGRMEVYVDPKFPVDEVLMGYRGDYYHAGYTYCPYMPFTESPIDANCRRYRLQARYAKRLTADGAAYYTRIILEDYSYSNEAKEE